MNRIAAYALIALIAFLGITPCLAAQNWNLTTAPITNWSALATSADGTILIAAACKSPYAYISPGAIFVSTNSGSTWIAVSAPITNWVSLSCSADGLRLVAAVGQSAVSYEPGAVYLSTNSGLSWTVSCAPPTNWVAVA